SHCRWIKLDDPGTNGPAISWSVRWPRSCPAAVTATRARCREMLQPLQRLAAAGVAVLVLHHPRKKPCDEGSSARGSGAVLGFVDIILELHRSGRLLSDERRRRLVGLSRHAQTPRQLVYEWDPA